MAARTVDDLLAAQDAAKARARAELLAIVARLDPSKPYAVRGVLLEAMPALIEKYGDVMAEVSAEFFEDVIGGKAHIPGPRQPAAYYASTRNALTPLFQSGNMTATVTALTGSMQRHINQSARETLMESARRTSGVAYARVLRGPRHCAFCTVMAGRGALYGSENLAGDFGKQFNDYHDFCDCQVIPIRSESDWPKGYNHKKYEKMYEDVLDKAKTGRLKGGESLMQKDADGKLAPVKAKRDPNSPDYSILQAMRDEYGLH